MKLVIRTVLFQMVCIVVFGLLYFGLQESDDEHLDELDALLLSVTIQAGVGMTQIVPNSTTCKIVMIFQQLIMISSYVFILYVFTL